MGKHSRKARIVFWSILGASAVLVVLFVAILIPNLIIVRTARPYVVAYTNSEAPVGDTAPHAQAAIVLGAGVHPDGTPSPMLFDRMLTGVSLYTTGKVDKLLLSGDDRQVEVMLAFALQRGVPDKDIFTDHGGFNTFLSMYRAVHLYEVKNALIVTQDFHMPRAVYVARALGIDATGVIVQQTQPYGTEIDDYSREWLARVKAAIQLGLTHPSPAVSGPVVPIEGDGRATRQ